MYNSEIIQCRSCEKGGLKKIFSMGKTPISDRLLTKEQIFEPALEFPLDLMFCPHCSLVQISYTVSPEILFCQNYPYFSSVSPQLMEHFRQSAIELMTSRDLDENSLVIEAASNDGYLLKHFVERGVKVLGVDPAKEQAKIAEQKGVPTINSFFNLVLAKTLVNQGKKADLFLANNVLAHVADTNGFVEGIRTVLKRDGVAVIELPYLVDLIEHCEFDTIYHQHLCYFSVTALDHLFRRHELYLNDIQHTNIHGGSLRIFVERQENVKKSVLDYLRTEQENKVTDFSYYQNFAKRVEELKDEVTGTLKELKQQGKKIVGYGAAAKANTFLSYMGINKNFFDYVVDLSKFKQGRFFDKSHLPIHAPSKLLEDQPDYVFILAWNFSDEIIKQQKEYHQRGGKFIVPIPKLEIV